MDINDKLWSIMIYQAEHTDTHEKKWNHKHICINYCLHQFWITYNILAGISYVITGNGIGLPVTSAMFISDLEQ